MASKKKEKSESSEERPKKETFREFSLDSVFKNISECDERDKPNQFSPFCRNFPLSPTMLQTNTGLI